MKLGYPFDREYPFTSGYGKRSYYINGKLVNDFHDAIDIAPPLGTPIYPAAPGRVMLLEFASNGGAGGNVVKIRHNDGTITVYAHCDQMLVKVGQNVDRSTVIATVGKSGSSTGPHLHFAYWTGAAHVDPIPFMDFKDYAKSQVTAPPPVQAPRIEGDFYLVRNGGWRSQIIQEIIDAGIWSGTWQENQDKFNRLNPETPSPTGWRANIDKVRIREAQIEIPKENPVEIERLTKENRVLTINLTALQEKHDTLEIDFKKHKDDTKKQLKIESQKYDALNTLYIETKADRDFYKTQLDNLNIKVDSIIKERDDLRTENESWRGKALTGDIKPADYPSKRMYIWKKLEARFGKKFTYNATNFLAGTISTFILASIGYLTGHGPEQFIKQYLPALLPIYLIVQPTLVAHLRDKSSKNKIFLHVVHLFNPEYDPYGNRQDALEAIKEKVEEESV
jgi:regulator of replication initiation timing